MTNIAEKEGFVVLKDAKAVVSTQMTQKLHQLHLHYQWKVMKLFIQ
jgi:hypothetical protein